MMVQCPYCGSTDIILPQHSECVCFDDDDSFVEVSKCTCYDCLKDFKAKMRYTNTEITYEKEDEE